MTKQTALSMKKVKAIAKQNNKTIKHEFNDGSTLTFSPIFSETKITELLKEFQSKLQHSAKKGIRMSEEFIYFYVHFLCIKHFTHLSKDISDDFEVQIDQMEELRDSKHYEEIVEEVFSPQELSKIWDKITDIMSRVAHMEKLSEQVAYKTEKLAAKHENISNVLNDIGN
jgi:hypothetical protein